MLPFSRRDELTKVVVQVRELTKDVVVGGVLLHRGDVEVIWPDGRSSFYARHYYRRRFVPLQEAEAAPERAPFRLRLRDRPRLQAPRRPPGRQVTLGIP